MEVKVNGEVRPETQAGDSISTLDPAVYGVLDIYGQCEGITFEP
jgi:hypothetical protein